MAGKVIYVSYIRLTDKESRDWYIDYLIAKGVDVEYWDIVSLIREEYIESGTKHTDYLHTFRTYDEVEAMLRLPEYKNASYVIMIPYEGRTAKIYKLLSKYDCRLVSLRWGVLPVSSSRGWRAAVVRLLSNPVLFVRSAYNKVKAIVYRKLRFVKPFDVVFAAGEVLMAREDYCDRSVPINMADYDNYIKVKSKVERPVQGRYAVFLDVNLPYHSDYQLIGLKAIDPNCYFHSLNMLFSLLEVEYGVKIVIAAHPKADYGANTFQGREIYRGLIAELVKDADFVISHHSAAISYAVLNLKPIVFLYSNEMLQLYRTTLVSYTFDFASYLDAAIYNIDEITQGDQISIGEINKNRYEDYKYKFLTTRESEYKNSPEVFWHEISADLTSQYLGNRKWI